MRGRHNQGELIGVNVGDGGLGAGVGGWGRARSRRCCFLQVLAERWLTADRKPV